MRVIRKRPGHPPEVVDVGESVESIQAEVGGIIERIPMLPDVAVIIDWKWRREGKPVSCNILGAQFGGTVLLAGMDGEKFRDLPRLDMLLWSLFRTVRYTRADRANNVWKCRRCSHLEQFEADGPFENGWNLCPCCGGFILQPGDSHAAD